MTTAVDLGGGVRVTPFVTATWRSDASPLFGPVPKLLWSSPVGDELDADERIPMASVALLVDTADGRVLVNPGPGERPSAAVPAMVGFEASGLGALERAVAADPRPLDAIVLTDLRAEHAGALLRPDGRARFPGTRIVAQAAEWGAALRRNDRIALMVDQDAVRGLAGEGTAILLDGSGSVVPGVEVIATGGFTTGHQVVLIRGRGSVPRTLVAFGDLLPRRWSGNPRWVTALDDLPLESVTAKTELFARAAGEGWIVIPSHEPGAPMGRLVPDRDRYRFEAS